ncbi:MAG: urease accessory UreF family protein [Pseudomonadota bacterium]
MNLALIRLLHLASPTLPVGAYTYSQGLEWAVESGVVRDEATALAWIGDCLEWGVAQGEAVYLAAMLAAWREDDRDRLAALDADFLASRETAELHAETLQMGHSLVRLLRDLNLDGDEAAPAGAGLPANRRPIAGKPAPTAGLVRGGHGEPRGPASGLEGFSTPSFPLAWSHAAARWAIPDQDAVAGYLWAWAENQVLAALKAVPLGQTAGQRLLLVLGERLPDLARRAIATPAEQACNFLPALAIASSRHETQYTRIFRS